MPRKTQRHLFTRNGKEVTSYKDVDSVISLIDEREQIVLESIDSIITNQEITESKEKIKIHLGLVEKMQEELDALKQRHIKLIPTMWASSTAVLTALVLFLITTGTPNVQRVKLNKYSMFSSKPLTLSTAVSRLFGGTTESATLDAVLESYNCPLAGMGKVFVKEAEKNNIPYWFVAAISFQESGCGRRTPKLEGVDETYNAWGWGVWGENLRTFNSWEEGIERVSKYLGDEFFSQGVTDPCEIMKTYTPPSDGSWCNGVKYFGDMITNYQTPEI